MLKLYSGIYPAVTKTTYKTSQYIQEGLDSILNFISYLNLINSREFKKLLEKDLELILTNRNNKKEWEKANNFFEEHTQFLLPYFANNNPGVAAELWLKLLGIMAGVNSKKYLSIHKGTAYYHAGVWSLFAGRYTEALQWLEYAYEEDIRLNEPGRRPEEYPAGWLLALDLREGKQEKEKGNDHNKTKELVELLKNKFKEINREFGESFEVKNFSGIAREKILKSEKRSLRSSWASLLASVWEFKRLQQFLVASPQKTEAQFEVNNFLVNLTLILETIIPYEKRTKEITLLELYKGKIFKKYKKYGLKSKGGKKSDSIDAERVFLSKGFPYTYRDICQKMKNTEKEDGKLAVAFTLAYRIRNQTHHMFNEEYIGLEMFNMIAIRIYYVISKVLNDFYS